ncbi:hypothetical protein TYRP_001456 [Tyrophagus putrescentiae]|nr:hypothetical protein TYRP_001456 [Tyrophagus putrescentiae]
MQFNNVRLVGDDVVDFTGKVPGEQIFTQSTAFKPQKKTNELIAHYTCAAISFAYQTLLIRGIYVSISVKNKYFSTCQLVSTAAVRPTNGSM